MKFYTYLLLPFLMSGCQNSAADKKVKAEVINRSKADSFPSQKSKTITQIPSASKEYISWDSVRINGKLPLVTKKKVLFSLIGMPDSIVSPDMNDVCVSFYDRDFKYAYLSNTQMEIYGDTAVVSSIDFRKGTKLSIKTPKLILDKNTSLVSLEKYFPKAVKEQYELKVHGIGNTVAVSIPTSKEPSDDSWLLFFLNGKLIRIDYWMPC